VSNKNKQREGIVYSTNPDYNYTESYKPATITVPPNQQTLRIRYETKHRAGKMVTIVSTFVGTDDDLNELGKFLKTKCGTGGSVKDGEILIQGDFRERIKNLLLDKGYKVKGG
jgi:translation initiation factor 1